jgi:hypothetical protein
VDAASTTASPKTAWILMSTAPHNDEIESRLAEISDALVNASTCFDVWHEMRDGRKRTVYEPVVDEYPVVFETTVIAHLIAVSTSLYSILETRHDTHNIPGLESPNFALSGLSWHVCESWATAVERERR